MRKSLRNVFLISFLMMACRQGKKAPDVSDIPLTVKIERFDRDFFAVDSTKLQAELLRLNQQYPYFLEDFAVNMLGTEPLSDTSAQAYKVCRSFLSSYMPLKDSLSRRFDNMDPEQKDLQQALKYIRHYFPTYNLPPKVVAYIGPFDAPGAAITKYTLAIGLQLYAGRNFSFYQSAQGQELFPLYISRRFEPEYIVPNCIKAVLEDIYADQSAGKPLIEEMIEKGKNWYALDLLLPATADSLKTGYTTKQLGWCAANEGQIWNYFLQNDLYTIDPELIKSYIGDGPYTQGMPEASPGNIGQWVGWQIVRKYMDGHADLTIPALLKTPAKQIFEGAKYKPK